MRVLVLNVGSSSVKASVVDAATGAEVAAHETERVARDGVRDAIGAAIDALGQGPFGAVAHRIVHGGERFTDPVRLDDAVVGALDGLVSLAPLHLPGNLLGVRVARERLPDVPHVAIFDTAFHATLPRRAWRYALPVELSDRLGLRRYGFHGISHAYVAARAAEHLGRPLAELRLITCHLGNGCSVAAIELGRSIDTSMGMTPLEGLVMGTRSGNVDPGLLLHLMRAEGLDADGLDRLLNRESGLAGLSGRGGNLRDIQARAADGDARCREAIQVFCHRLRKYVGAYAAVLGGVDAIVFTGGIGENSAEVRHRTAQRLEFLGAALDEDTNRDARVSADAPGRASRADVAEIGNPAARCRLLVVATDEALEMARQAAAVVADAAAVAPDRAIPIAISARHVHLDQATLETLFGPGAALTSAVALSQPGQFAAAERVHLVGPRGRIDNVRIVGPVRKRVQVEVSRSDEFALGVDAPIRCSGDLDHTPGLTLEGPAGRVTLASGVIQSQRHIHMTPADAERMGVRHKDIVRVAIDSQGRDLVFGDVVVRVAADHALELHLDTDEGNAAEITKGAVGEVLCATPVSAVVTRVERGAR